MFSKLEMIDLCDIMCLTTHEEEWDTEQCGGGQHDHRETWDGLQGQTHPLHDDSTYQHPHSDCWQIQCTCGPQTAIADLYSLHILFICTSPTY